MIEDKSNVLVEDNKTNTNEDINTENNDSDAGWWVQKTEDSTEDNNNNVDNKDSSSLETTKETEWSDETKSEDTITEDNSSMQEESNDNVVDDWELSGLLQDLLGSDNKDNHWPDLSLFNKDDTQKDWETDDTQKDWETDDTQKDWETDDTQKDWETDDTTEQSNSLDFLDKLTDEDISKLNDIYDEQDEIVEGLKKENSDLENNFQDLQDKYTDLEENVTKYIDTLDALSKHNVIWPLIKDLIDGKKVEAPDYLKENLNRKAEELASLSWTNSNWQLSNSEVQEESLWDILARRNNITNYF